MTQKGAADGRPILVALCRLPQHDADAAAARGLMRFSAAMRDEITRYRRAEDRLARVAARLLLRRMLLMLGLPAFADLARWQRSASARPSLQDCSADFSLSHSERWVAVAAGIGYRLGIDIEPYRPLDPQPFYPFLTAAEKRRLAHAGQPARELLQSWSLREAVLKAEGCGLLVDDAVIRAIGEGIYPSGHDWWIRARDFEDSCVTLAVDRAPARLMWRKLAFESLADAGPPP